MPLFIDQTGQELQIDRTPKRIISLVPSQTELLFDLGLKDKVIGITKFCIHPEEWFRSKTRIGGTKQLNIKLIKQLQPDLIIANKEENVKEQIRELEKYFPVWISDVNNLENAYEMIEQIGLITHKETAAKKIADTIKKNFARLQTRNPKLRTCYLIWQDPYMTVGGDTFIHSMLEAAGFNNIFTEQKRYPAITIDQLLNAHCQLLLLSSEPYPFKQKHIDELQTLIPDTKIVLVDGEMFSWYGSRILKAPEYFISLQQQINERPSN
jgi:ABC-type Fe3+-hydroxamate transport system substrate-binding protein